MRQLLFGLAWCVLLSTGLACGGDVITENSSDAVVRGRIAGPDAAPVMGAVVHLAVFTSSGEPVVDATATTQANGEYEAHLSAFLVAPFTGELRVVVSPPSGAALAETTREGIPIRLGAEPIQTVTLDLSLPEAGA